MARNRRRGSPYLTEAQARAVVRFDPEIAALQALLKNAQSTFKQGVAASRGAADYTIGEIRSARPDIKRAYRVPGLNPAQAMAEPKLPEAGALDFNAASTFESQAAQRRLLTERAAALADLGAQRVAAAQGAQFGAQQARQQYQQDVGTIADRLIGLAGQKGAFIVGELGQLEREAAQRALTRRGQDVTARGQDVSARQREADRRERRRAARARERVAQQKANEPDAPKSPFTPVQRRATARTYRTGLDALKSLQVPRSGESAMQAAKEILLNGLKSEDGKTTIQAAITDDRTLAQIMAERYVNGSLSKASYRKLLKLYGVKGKRRSAVTDALNAFG